jgi:hypothetical protein
VACCVLPVMERQFQSLSAVHCQLGSEQESLLGLSVPIGCVMRSLQSWGEGPPDETLTRL